ncbi:hypothetical protein [Anoxybacillus flavithermus]|uniref:hypothetical protein n=1 Tax=Anoxybacillus flavithermus TaxID=33934 RepID=UPI00186716B2|nr:hypothetical protein [Anoxybacillus flavithermus]MBE2914588.1 hypothetical protein [Anoxybacillus flavithermus]
MKDLKQIGQYTSYSKYKDPRIDWIGEVPEHWEIRKLKYISKIVTGGTPPKSEAGNYDENGIPWIKPDNFDFKVETYDTKEKISTKGLSYVDLIPANSSLVACIGSIKVGVTIHPSASV